MNNEEAIKEIENYLDYEGSVSIQAIATLYTLYEKEKQKNKLLKTYKGNLPENVEMICLCKDDFERNISSDYVKKDVIREYRKKFIKDKKAEETFMTQSSQINNSLISFCEVLLDE